MQKFKEFQGKDLDECIRAACGYFDAPREKLEIEIVQDAKSGIFGIVGARKAKIKARRTCLADTVQSILGETKVDAPARRPHQGRSDVQKKENFRQKFAGEESVEPAIAAAETKVHKAGTDEKPVVKEVRKREETEVRQKTDETNVKQAGKQQTHEAEPPVFESDPDVALQEDDADGLKFVPFEQLDMDRLKSVAQSVMETLARPVAGRDVTVSVKTSGGQVRIKIDWQGDAGLLIGREGQTLAAMQYLASRIISRDMNAIVRVQLDIGEYRSRQDDRLRELAISLAERARESGKPCSTRPLSSYHRRIIHLCLQNDPGVQTRSSGEGALKRVIISPKRTNGRG